MQCFKRVAMPKIPKLLADLVASVNKKAVVTNIHYYHPQFKKIVFQGDDLKGLKCKPGAQIEPRVSDTDFRHYNPSAFDSSTGTCEMLIYLHKQGAGSRWAENVQPGEPVYLMGPANKISLNTSAPKVVLLGDETAIGTFLFMQNGLSKAQQLYGAVETEKHLQHLPQLVGLRLPVVVRRANRAEALLDIAAQYLPHTNAQFYLLGHAGTNKLLKRYLTQNGINSSQITTVKYWEEGRSGL